MSEPNETDPYTIAGIFGAERRKHTRNLKESIPNSLTNDEWEFWNGDPPNEIVIATGSYRKALLVAYELTGFVRPAFNHEKQSIEYSAKSPLEFQDYLYTQVRNGNGSVAAKTFVGHFKGVPVYIQPSEEDNSNEDAVAQARKKIEFLAAKYVGQDVLLIATDSVTLPHGLQSPLGKPMNEVGFKEAEFDAANYFKAMYKPGSEITQYNGLAFLFMREVGEFYSGEFPLAVSAAIHTWLSTLTVQFTQEVYTRILNQAAKIVSIGAAGGGVFQHAVPFDGLSDQQVVKRLYDPETAEKLLQILDELREWCAYDSIAGLGWWDIVQEIERYMQKSM